jgi:hypothetical protein
MSILRSVPLSALILSLSLAVGCAPLPGAVDQTPSTEDSHTSHAPELSKEKLSVHAVDSHNIQIKGAAGAVAHGTGVLGFKGELLEMPGEASKSFAIEVGGDGAFTSASIHVHDGGKVTLFAFAERSGGKAFSQPLTLVRRDLDATKLKFEHLDDHNVNFSGDAGAVSYGTNVVAFKGEHTSKPDADAWKTFVVQADGSLPVTKLHLHDGDQVTFFAEAEEEGKKVYSKPATLTVD